MINLHSSGFLFWARGWGWGNVPVSTVQEQIGSLRESAIFYEIHSYSRRKVGSKLIDLLIPFN